MGSKFAVLDNERRITAFYDDAWHAPSSIPAGAIEISDEDHEILIRGQTAGKCMALDADGSPAFVDHPPRPVEERMAIARRRRDRLLADSDGIVERHRDQVEEESPRTLSDEQYRAYMAYRRALRDLPEHPAFPDVEWPAAPA
jgi:hypothetical protein